MDADVESSPAEVDEHDGGGAGADVDDEIDTDLDEGGGPAGLSWTKVALLVVALAFLGFAVGMFVTRDRPPGADSADVGFLQDMITHHDQALGIATLEAAYGEDPVVRSYARDVLTFQSYEIGVMTQMLADWGFTARNGPTRRWRGWAWACRWRACRAC